MYSMIKKELFITFLGVFLGLIAGYTYYHYIGCETGTCAITSKPINSSLYGGLMGGLLFNLFLNKNKKK